MRPIIVALNLEAKISEALGILHEMDNRFALFTEAERKQQRFMRGQLQVSADQVRQLVNSLLQRCDSRDIEHLLAYKVMCSEVHAVCPEGKPKDHPVHEKPFPTVGDEVVS